MASRTTPTSPDAGSGRGSDGGPGAGSAVEDDGASLATDDGIGYVDGGGTSLHRVHERATVAIGDRAAFFPALDGVRAVAVIGVILFHSGFTWAQGGFLGVSTFFTLSGFLIARLLMMEARDTGRIDAKRFFIRRARRLLPAGMIGILLAALVVILDERLVTTGGVGWDLVSAQFAVANWRFAFSGQRYADLFATPSPVLHYWSLAIEEQFYLGLLAVLLISIRLTRQAKRAVIPWVLLGLTVVLMIVSYTIPKSIDRAYYGTDTRALEFMTGALLAVVLVHWRQWRARLHIPAWLHDNARPALGLLSVLALQGMIVCWVIAEHGDTILYNGGFLAFSFLSAAVIGACLVEGTPVAWLLSAGPLRYIGRISYGIYVFHWPIFLWLNTDRVGVDGAPLLALRLAVTLALAAASYHLIEVPVREARAPWTRGAPVVRVAGAVGLIVVLASASFIGATRKPVLLTGDVGETAGQGDGGAEEDPAVDFGPIDTSPVRPAGAPHAAPQTELGSPLPLPEVVDPSRPLRVMVVGDSTALHLSPGLKRWGKETGTMQVYTTAAFGCGIIRSEQVIGQSAPQVVPDVCRNWETTWRAKIDAFQPDVVVVSSSLWDANDQMLPDGSFSAPGEPGYTAWASSEYAAALDVLHEQGADVVWARNPSIQLAKYRGATPERMAALNGVLEDLAAERPWMRLAPYDEFVAAWDADGDRPPLLADGLHVSLDRANDAGWWLGPEVLADYWQMQGS